VKEANALLGDGVKRATDGERATIAAARRSVVAKRDLPAGHVVSWDDLDWLRPGGGLAPGLENVVLGRALRAPITAGTPLDKTSVQ
jgi:N-acetylneuraminate synthase/N,N'-diacetyllegionaminate synthase